MRNVFRLALIAYTLALAIYSCKDKCKPCNSGAECIDGTCMCEPEHFYFNGQCVNLGSDAYVGINTGCYCYDTLAIGILGTGEERKLGIPVKSGKSVGSLLQNVFYYEISDGDSLYSPEIDYKCYDADKNPIKPALYGKKQSDGSWKVRLEFHNTQTYEVVDNCTMLLKKFQ